MESENARLKEARCTHVLVVFEVVFAIWACFFAANRTLALALQEQLLTHPTRWLIPRAARMLASAQTLSLGLVAWGGTLTSFLVYDPGTKIVYIVNLLRLKCSCGLWQVESQALLLYSPASLSWSLQHPDGTPDPGHSQL